MRGIIAITLLVCIAALLGCESDNTTSLTTFSGKITGAEAIAVTKVVDLNRMKIEVVKRIRVSPDGSFSEPLDNIEHIFTR